MFFLLLFTFSALELLLRLLLAAFAALCNLLSYEPYEFVPFDSLAALILLGVNCHFSYGKNEEIMFGH